MSLIAGLHLGNFALIAADKRVMNIIGDKLVIAHNKAEKIVSSGLGYVSGSGIVELLDFVKEAISNTEITHTDQILAIIASERERFRSLHSDDSEWAGLQVQKTGWLFTYNAEDGCNSTVRIALAHGAWDDDKIHLLHKGAASVIVPINGTGEESQRLSDILTQNLKTTDELPDFTENISYHVHYLQSLFKHVSETCESVSECFHIAVHKKDGDMLISKEITTSSSCVNFTCEQYF